MDAQRQLYLVFAEDVSDSEALRAPLREAHIERRAQLHAQGRVRVSGPLVDSDAPDPYCGSLLVAEFPSLEAARAWAEADPYVAAGVYARMVVRRINTHFLAGA
ncbi:YciI family protein [Variovorax terrae]|uniref:YciI family protein n=1 Tax=Variovorax terrae TaxID=2923278 RepID=A0A9X1VWC2_9BURK|nr:YciI family protein [Variovorax terrae]MCJ0764383.1 YciI family protein [Variovorax terrae]